MSFSSGMIKEGRMEEERRNELILKGIEIITGEDKEQLKTFTHLVDRCIEAGDTFEGAHSQLITFVEQGE